MTFVAARIDDPAHHVHASDALICGVCNINASTDACKFLPTRSLRNVSVLSVCRSLLPQYSPRQRNQQHSPHIHNGRLFMVSVFVITIVLICLTDDQFSYILDEYSNFKTSYQNRESVTFVARCLSILHVCNVCKTSFLTRKKKIKIRINKID